VNATAQRLDAYSASPEAMRALMALELAVAHLALAPSLLSLVRLRASQLNRCAFCIDIEVTAALQGGESARRLDALHAWREAGMFSRREQLALAWTEAITLPVGAIAADRMLQQLPHVFSEREIADLTLAIVAIHQWNTMGAAFRRRLY
jgi:AhpD family alkylhydroperoxidase